MKTFFKVEGYALALFALAMGIGMAVTQPHMLTLQVSHPLRPQPWPLYILLSVYWCAMARRIK